MVWGAVAPWWNPAVEDQASDRAHRIGQKRPITVYSLIALHTIEEKIVDLHKTKRALARDSLNTIPTTNAPKEKESPTMTPVRM